MGERNVWLGMRRGLAQRCPNCGEGRLFRKYLKVQSPCEVCSHDNDQYPADDAPPYFTIFLVGHVVIGPMLFFNFVWRANLWLVIFTTLPALFVLSLIALPLVKGACIGAMWAMGFKRPEIGKTKSSGPELRDQRS